MYPGFPDLEMGTDYTYLASWNSRLNLLSKMKQCMFEKSFD